MFNKNGAVQGRMLDALGLDKEDLDLESVTQTLNRMASNDPNGPARSLLKLAQTLQAYKGEVSRPDGRSLSALSKEFIALVETKQKEFEASPDFLNLARQSLDEAGAEEIKVLLDVAGIKGVSKEQISRSQLVGAIAKIAACAAAFAILGKTLDVGANIMAESLPFLGKGMVAALVVSALTSIPEFVVSKKLIEDNKDDRGAIQNVAYSNLYNLMIAKFSVSLRLGRNALFGG
jgi:hypothetical protein